MHKLKKYLSEKFPAELRAKQITRIMVAIIFFMLFVFLILSSSTRFDQRSAPYKIYYVGKTNNLSIEFWRTIDEGLNAAAKEFNVDLTQLNASDEWRVDENLAEFEKAVAAKPDAIILSAADYEVLAEPVANAIKSGQKIVMLDSDVKRIENAEPLSLIATNNQVAGQTIAEYISADLNADAKVVIIVQQLGVATADQRRQGVLDILTEKGITNIVTIDAHGSKETAKTELLKTIDNGAIDVVIAVNEYTTEAAALALKEANLAGSVPLAGIDSSRLLVPFIEDGTIKASVVQQPYNIAYLSVKAAVDALSGQKIPSQIDVESKLITKDDIYLPENQKLLFPFQHTN